MIYALVVFANEIVLVDSCLKNGSILGLCTLGALWGAHQIEFHAIHKHRYKNIVYVLLVFLSGFLLWAFILIIHLYILKVN